MTGWEQNARALNTLFGVWVDWEERFYICPFCGEPVYECDWGDDELRDYWCPICEDADAE